MLPTSSPNDNCPEASDTVVVQMALHAHRVPENERGCANAGLLPFDTEQ